MDVLCACLITLCGIVMQLKTCTSSPLVDTFKTEDFLRCKGMKCEAWDEAQSILRDLRKETYTDDNKLADDYASLLGTGSYFTSGWADNSTTEGVVEGDIWVTPEQAVLVREELSARRKRKLAYFSLLSAKWTLPIKYYIDGDFSDEQNAAIKGATHHFESQTCIVFQELSLPEALFEEDQFLYFLKGQSGCGTFIGRMHTVLARPQVIQLEDVCIEQWGAVVHEIGHTIGFWHEHQRSDRHQYVSIFPDRMKPTADQKQYEPGLTRDLLPYDYGSVMHYWAWAFSTSLLNVTIAPHDPLYLYTIGQKIGLSFLDAKLANMEYCADSCSTPIACHNNGYQNPLLCGVCKCPDGFGGSRCEQLASPQKANCGGTIRLTADGQYMSTYIKSPGYDERENYEDRTECTWLIEAPEGHKVSLRFMNLARDHFGMYCRYPVCFHYVEVKLFSSDLSVTGPRFCCERLPGRGNSLPGTLTSDGRHLMVLMRSNFTTSDQSLKMGFRAYVSATRDDNVLPEPGTTPEPFPGPQPRLDVAFIMDSSGSVGLRNWNRIKEFAKNIISHFTLGRNHFQFGFITFGSEAYLDMRLDDFDSVRLVHRKIDSLPWKRESSNIADGLRAARSELFSSALGDRVSVQNLAVLLTDGPATAETGNTLDEAIALRQESALMVIGVGPGVDRSEMTALANDPPYKFVRFVDDFQQLGDVEIDVVDLMWELSGADELIGTSCMDITYLLDSSGSVKRYNWPVVLKFVQTMITSLVSNTDTVQQCHTRNALVSFANEASYDVTMGCHAQNRTLLDKIMQIKWKDRWTNTASALRLMNNRIFNSENYSNCRKIGILITNGVSNMESERTLTEANTAHARGVALFVVGIGPSFDAIEAGKITQDRTRVKALQEYRLLLFKETQDFVRQWVGQAGAPSRTPRTSTTASTTTTTTEPTTTTTEPTTTTTTTEPTTTTTTTTTTAQAQQIFDWSCNFESWEYNGGSLGCGGVTQDRRDQFDWTRISGRTPSEPTGPSGAASGRYYMFIEASRPRRNNDKARLYTPPVPSGDVYCLTFSYNMRGFHVNKLVVEMHDSSGVQQDVWTERGEQGPRWFSKSLSIFLQPQAKIAFTGVTGDEYSGDIAIDDLRLVLGEC